MTGFMRACAVLAATLGVFFTHGSNGHAAGALAIGKCAAYGYSFDYGRVPDAQAEAMRKCKGAQCRVVTTMRRACAAFAIDGGNACGPHGYATANRLGQAQNVALQHCYKYGGRNCVIRAWACDAKG